MPAYGSPLLSFRTRLQHPFLSRALTARSLPQSLQLPCAADLAMILTVALSALSVNLLPQPSLWAAMCQSCPALCVALGLGMGGAQGLTPGTLGFGQEGGLCLVLERHLGADRVSEERRG